MARIRRDFLPPELRTLIGESEIDGAISVQARQSLEETDWLLELATEHDFIRGVVGWLPLAAPEIEGLIDHYASREKLVGVRHVVQSEPTGFLHSAEFNRGIDALRGHELVYDILVVERQLPEVITFVDQHPDQLFALDHIAKPRIRDGALEPWRTNLLDLARRDHVVCKLSGLVTEADVATWTPEHLRPYVDTVLAAFGPDRLMFGSDWPVCLVACDYPSWIAGVTRMLAELSADEQGNIMGGVATRIYQLPS